MIFHLIVVCQSSNVLNHLTTFIVVVNLHIINQDLISPRNRFFFFNKWFVYWVTKHLTCVRNFFSFRERHRFPWRESISLRIDIVAWSSISNFVSNDSSHENPPEKLSVMINFRIKNPPEMELDNLSLVFSSCDKVDRSGKKYGWSFAFLKNVCKKSLLTLGRLLCVISWYHEGRFDIAWYEGLYWHFLLIISKSPS